MQLNKKEINEFKNRGFCIVDIGCKNHLINLRKNFIVMNENRKDKKIPINTKKLNSIFSLNKSFIPNALAPNKAGMDK